MMKGVLFGNKLVGSHESSICPLCANTNMQQNEKLDNLATAKSQMVTEALNAIPNLLLKHIIISVWPYGTMMKSVLWLVTCSHGSSIHTFSADAKWKVRQIGHRQGPNGHWSSQCHTKFVAKAYHHLCMAPGPGQHDEECFCLDWGRDRDRHMGAFFSSWLSASGFYLLGAVIPLLVNHLLATQSRSVNVLFAAASRDIAVLASSLALKDLTDHALVCCTLELSVNEYGFIYLWCPSCMPCPPLLATNTKHSKLASEQWFALSTQLSQHKAPLY